MGLKIIKTDEKVFTFSAIMSFIIYFFTVLMLVFCLGCGIAFFVLHFTRSTSEGYLAAAGTFFVGVTAGLIQLIILFRNKSLAKKDRIKFTISIFEKYQVELKLIDTFAKLYDQMICALSFNGIDADNKDIVSALFTIALFNRRILDGYYKTLSQMEYKVLKVLDKMQNISVNINNWEMSGQIDKKLFKKTLSPYKKQFEIIDKIKDAFY